MVASLVDESRRMRTGWRRGLGGALAMALALCTAVAAAQSVAEPEPYVARYRVRYRGLSGGVIEFALRKDQAPGQFIYESRAFPSMLGRLMISKGSHERSVIVVDADGVRPLSFFAEDGTPDTSKDADLRFDWERHRLTGRAQNKDVDLPLPDHTQDHLSIQIAVMVDLLRGREPTTYSLVDDAEIKQYEYLRDGAAKVRFKDKEYDTVILRSSRVGNSRRSNRYWQATDLGYLPLRAERASKGDVDLTLDLEDVKKPQ